MLYDGESRDFFKKGHVLRKHWSCFRYLFAMINHCIIKFWCKLHISHLEERKYHFRNIGYICHHKVESTIALTLNSTIALSILNNTNVPKSTNFFGSIFHFHNSFIVISKNPKMVTITNLPSKLSINKCLIQDYIYLYSLWSFSLWLIITKIAKHTKITKNNRIEGNYSNFKTC